MSSEKCDVRFPLHSLRTLLACVIAGYSHEIPAQQLAASFISTWINKCFCFIACEAEWRNLPRHLILNICSLRLFLRTISSHDYLWPNKTESETDFLDDIIAACCVALSPAVLRLHYSLCRTLHFSFYVLISADKVSTC